MITIVVGTNRKSSNSAVLAGFVEELLRNKGESVQVLNLEDLPNDFIFSDAYGERTDVFMQIAQKFIIPVDKFIFVIPEYNGGFPGVLKAFVDCLEPKWLHHKKAGLIGLSSGRAGSLRAMDQFTNVLHYLKMHVHFKKPKLSGFERALSPQKKLQNSQYLDWLNEFADEMKIY